MYRIEKTDQFALIHLGLYSNEAADAIDSSINLLMCASKSASESAPYCRILNILIRDNILKSWCWRTLDGECYIVIPNFVHYGAWNIDKSFEEFCECMLQFLSGFSSAFSNAKVIFSEICNDQSQKHSVRYEELISGPFNPFIIAQLDVLYKERSQRLVNCIFVKDLYEKVEEIENEIRKTMKGAH